MKKINWNYTLGEILIVIIGITIAFSMNRCSENAKNNTLKEQYLVNLMNDIETDKKNLESNLERLNFKKKTIGDSFQYFYGNRPKGDSILAMNFFRTVQLIEFSAKNTTYQTLINSGDLNLIDNFETKTAIQEHYRIYGQLKQDYDRMENISREYVADYFIYNMDMDLYRAGGSPFKDKTLLKSIMQSIYGAVDLKMASTERSIESCQGLLAQLEKDD